MAKREVDAVVERRTEGLVSLARDAARSVRHLRENLERTDVVLEAFITKPEDEDARHRLRYHSNPLHNGPALVEELADLRARLELLDDFVRALSPEAVARDKERAEREEVERRRSANEVHQALLERLAPLQVKEAEAREKIDSFKTMGRREKQRREADFLAKEVGFVMEALAVAGRRVRFLASTGGDPDAPYSSQQQVPEGWEQKGEAAAPAKGGDDARS